MCIFHFFCCQRYQIRLIRQCSGFLGSQPQKFSCFWIKHSFEGIWVFVFWLLHCSLWPVEISFADCSDNFISDLISSSNCYISSRLPVHLEVGRSGESFLIFAVNHYLGLQSSPLSQSFSGQDEQNYYLGKIYRQTYHFLIELFSVYLFSICKQ